jgi:hypothetical protein
MDSCRPCSYSVATKRQVTKEVVKREGKGKDRAHYAQVFSSQNQKKGNISLHPNAIADGNAQKVCVRTTITKKEKKRKIRPPLLHLVSCPL